MKKFIIFLLIAGIGAFIYFNRQYHFITRTAKTDLAAISEQINKSTPAEVDDKILLKRTVVEGENTLVFLYQLNVPKDEIDFPLLSGNIREPAKTNWCHAEDKAVFRKMGADIVYRYTDNAGAPVGEILIKTTECVPAQN
jgi:hypothetical protein